jgi:hypothetical protein
MPRAMFFSLRGTLPVLDIEGERIVDSTHIVEALERRYPEPALYPDRSTPMIHPSAGARSSLRTSSTSRPATTFAA